MGNSLKRSKPVLGCLLIVVALGLTACSSDKDPAGRQMTRPPVDDSETSSVRVTTSWIRHSLTQVGCLKHAQVALSKAGYFVDSGERSIFGFREGMTFSIRCDYEGVAFLAVAYRVRPSTEVQDRVLNQITRLF